MTPALLTGMCTPPKSAKSRPMVSLAALYVTSSGRTSARPPAICLDLPCERLDSLRPPGREDLPAPVCASSLHRSSGLGSVSSPLPLTVLHRLDGFK
jgi:hypothetical protein